MKLLSEDQANDPNIFMGLFAQGVVEEIVCTAVDTPKSPIGKHRRKPMPKG